MAIAGIILSASAAACAGLEKALQGRDGILDVQRTPDGADIGGLVVVVLGIAAGQCLNLQAHGVAACAKTDSAVPLLYRSPGLNADYCAKRVAVVKFEDRRKKAQIGDKRKSMDTKEKIKDRA